MDDFAIPNKVNKYGIHPSPSNFIKPGKRPQSSICPVIFTNNIGDVVFIAGASGGTRITTGLAQVGATKKVPCVNYVNREKSIGNNKDLDHGEKSNSFKSTQKDDNF